ncbi:MAG: acyl-CoA/acyl-ACP dehydrogenase [Proteobacteria bacterium]|nr:acyl-CoA/acyl-ACP dehydrogenase [Pseudomonadota bacterium]MCP4921088.1 acyl-CoA/acyl-ACP dehydrogenase [Pseudomonadota bacterium]
MHPAAHTLWAALWVSIATDAWKRAQGFVRKRARKTPGQMPPSTMRLAEVDAKLFTMRGSVRDAVRSYQDLLDRNDPAAFQANVPFATQMNNTKVTASQLMVEVVGGCMIICGIAGYRNDGKHSLARQLRNAYGAQIMVNNDRILGQSSPILLVRRGF